jgi:hypothetical protein
LDFLDEVYAPALQQACFRQAFQLMVDVQKVSMDFYQLG